MNKTANTGFSAIAVAGVILLGCPFYAVAQPAGTFLSVGNLNAGRRFPRATLLTSGSVLITGDALGADLYNPATRTFTLIETPMWWLGHSSTLLPNGRVLIAGGYPKVEGSGEAYLFDPSTRSFSRTGDMTRSRVGHTATLLNNGKVLLAGGEAPRPPYPADVTAELYDPDTGRFTTTGTFVDGGPLVASSTLLPDGNVLITGYYSGRAAIYDPATESFSPTRNRPEFHQAATLLPNGKVLLAGGTDDLGPDAHAETYDPETGSFTTEPHMTTERIGPSVTLLSDGTVLVMGGGLQNTADVYDPDARVFTRTAEMLVGRYGHSATLLPDGTVLVAGGGGCSECVASLAADIYRPAVVRPAAALLSALGETGSRGAILHAESHQEVNVNNPAVTGEALEIYGSGLIEGSLIPPQVTIGGRLAEILYFGIAPGLNGVSQVNVRVPAEITSGPSVPVRIRYMGRISNEVTLAIR